MEAHGGLHGGSWSSMEAPWRSVEAPWRSVETSMEVGGGSMEVGGDLHGGLWRLHGGRWRPPWRSVEAPWRSVETSMEVRGGSMEVHLHGPPWSSMSLHGVPDNVGSPLIDPLSTLLPPLLRNSIKSQETSITKIQREHQNKNKAKATKR